MITISVTLTKTVHKIVLGNEYLGITFGQLKFPLQLSTTTILIFYGTDDKKAFKKHLHFDKHLQVTRTLLASSKFFKYSDFQWFEIKFQ